MPCYHTPYVRIKSSNIRPKPSPTNLANPVAVNESTRSYTAEQKHQLGADNSQLCVQIIRASSDLTTRRSTIRETTNRVQPRNDSQARLNERPGKLTRRPNERFPDLVLDSSWRLTNDANVAWVWPVKRNRSSAFPRQFTRMARYNGSSDA